MPCVIEVGVGIEYLVVSVPDQDADPYPSTRADLEAQIEIGLPYFDYKAIPSKFPLLHSLFIYRNYSEV